MNNLFLAFSVLFSALGASLDEHWTNMSYMERNSPEMHVLSVEATHYTARCTGCSGITYTGIDVRNKITHKGYGIVAVDPAIIPLKSIVVIDGKHYKALDIGSAIKGARIDILVKTKKEAYKKGRVNKKIQVIYDF